MGCCWLSHLLSLMFFYCWLTRIVVAFLFEVQFSYIVLQSRGAVEKWREGMGGGGFNGNEQEWKEDKRICVTLLHSDDDEIPTPMLYYILFT